MLNSLSPELEPPGRLCDQRRPHIIGLRELPDPVALVALETAEHRHLAVALRRPVFLKIVAMVLARAAVPVDCCRGQFDQLSLVPGTADKLGQVSAAQRPI